MQNSNDALLITLNRLSTYDELIKEYIDTKVPSDVVTYTAITDSDGNIIEDEDIPVFNINNIDDIKISEDKSWSSKKLIRNSVPKQILNTPTLNQKSVIFQLVYLPAMCMIGQKLQLNLIIRLVKLELLGIKVSLKT